MIRLTCETPEEGLQCPVHMRLKKSSPLNCHNFARLLLMTTFRKIACKNTGVIRSSCPRKCMDVMGKKMQAIMCNDAWGQKKWPAYMLRDITAYLANGNHYSSHSDPQVSRSSLPVSHKQNKWGSQARKVVKSLR